MATIAKIHNKEVFEIYNTEQLNIDFRTISRILSYCEAVRQAQRRSIDISDWECDLAQLIGLE